MIPEDLQELKRLAQAATPAPWVQESYAAVQPDQRQIMCDPGRKYFQYDQAVADAAFIAAANPQTVLSLIAEVERLQSENEDFVEQLSIKQSCWEDHQRIMATNDHLLAELFAARARIAELEEAQRTENEWRSIDDLRHHWHMFCDCDPFDGSDTFADRMEACGFIELRAVTDDDLQSSFATERGIEAAGMVWELTEKGRAVLEPPKEG